MSIPPNSEWRGCAAYFQQPVENELGAQALAEHVYYFNTNPNVTDHPLADITYRSSSREEDITRHVFRWDRTGYQQVFLNGFEARRHEGTPDETYYSLDHYVHHGGRPLDSNRPTTHAFVSTTLNSGWRPTLEEGEDIQVYRYEIYAPGGIWVAQTLADQYRYPAQDEVCFVAGIAPQYIRSAQLFRGRRARGSLYPTWTRVEDVVIVNGYFNPQSHPSRLLRIQRPVHDYVAQDDTHRALTIRIFRPQREKRQVSVSEDATDWYAEKVANETTNRINSAFRASAENEAYVFVENQYVLLNYAPGTTEDKVINGPLLICDGFHSLIGTTFGENGIDCAFDTDGTEAFIFTGNLCAYIDYAPGTTDDKILRGPMTIAAMFPFFKRTVFEKGIDSAFKSSVTDEAYLFKGNQYALVNYSSNNPHLIAIRNITEGFYSLKDTIFEGGIDAAFASHRENEAYIFKGDQYALINFAPATTDDYIIVGVKSVLPNWPSLGGILGGNNRGIDSHDHHEQADRDHDEL